MTVNVQLDADFAFTGADTPNGDPAQFIAAQTAPDPLGALAILEGTWQGHGFNTIWRPHHPADVQDRFLELNLTDETLVFTRINGPIPNRGLAMPDIDMFGLTYLQQISGAISKSGLHIEPGIWATVPATSDPNEPSTVVRMASIPHGTVILAQGVASTIQGGPQIIPNNNILPFAIGSPEPTLADFDQVAQEFPELNLAIPTPFRSGPGSVTQDMVKNPNSVLQAALQKSLAGTTMKRRTFLHVSTTNQAVAGGGGLANTAFLATSGNPPGGNAKATEVDATFWVETIAGVGGKPDTLQLQYTQKVQLDFNGIRWPHVTVGTLIKQ